MTNTESIVQTKGEIELKSQAPTISGYGIVKAISLEENEQGNYYASIIILGLLMCFILWPLSGQAQVMYGGGGWAGSMKGPVLKTTITSAVTTNTTSTAIALPSGSKSIYGSVTGTGSVTQTQAIYGDVDNDAANGVLLCTITLSGTTRAQDACPVITANFSYYYVVTTATSGTSATGAVYAMY